ncbi:hypothetical protein [Pseudoxanthomonas winnipegensis]|uniref:hypothetical protein n=1 Tax=Pseudoxanthomonas winnipegensis TaxID=2480810 RepID=UPI001F25CE77|nr:hypothetical protein [Pseudoxanthomonas winnipegensis]
MRRSTAGTPAVDPLLSALLGDEASHLPPDLQSRLRAALTATGQPAANAERPAFFDHLRRARMGLEGSQGGNWAGLQAGHALPSRLHTVDIALAGLDGVLDVLAAGEYARYSSDPALALGEHLTDRLLHASRALIDLARDNLEDARELGCGERPL